MDSNLLAHVLSNTFNPDADIRHQSEAHLAQLEAQPGYCSSLLHIAVALPQDALPIKQAALLRLKHRIHKHWNPERSKARSGDDDPDSATAAQPAQSALTDADRAVIRDNIFEAVLQQHTPLLRVLLLECILAVLKAEPVTAWPALVPAILAALRSGDASRMYGALLVLRVLYKRWTFEDPKRRDGVVDALTAQVMPLLVPIFQHVSTQDSLDAYDVLRVITKITFLACQMRISPYLRTPVHALPVFQLLIHTVQRATPPHLLQAFVASSGLTPAQHPLWKAKKWAVQALVRVFSRWGQSGQVKEKAMKPFASFFTNKVSSAAFAAVVAVLKGRKDGQWVSSRVTQLCFVYLSHALRALELRRLMQKNLQFLLADCVLSVLCLTADDIRLFLTDPHEFIRQSLDLMEEYHDPRTAACNLLIDLVKVDARRQSNEALALSMQLIEHCFRSHAERRDSEDAIILKEGAMRMLGALRVVLMKDDAMQPAIESLLAQFVIPELSSQHGFMRSRALQLIGRYSRMDWRDQQRQAEGIVLVCQCLQPSNALPVRLEAASAISRLVRNEAVLSFIASQIPLVFSTFFDLMDEIGNEEVISTMQMLLGRIGEDVVQPYAAEVIRRLTAMCMQLLQAADDDDESKLAAAEALRTVCAVFYALGQNPEVVLAVEPLTHPLLTAIVASEEESVQEFFEDAVQLVHCIIDHASSVSPFLWQLFPRIVAAVSNWAVDYLSAIAAVTDLYTAHGGEGFVAGSKVLTGADDEESSSGLDVVMKLVLSIWKGGERQPETDAQCIQQQYACKMIESILAHHRGRVDHLLSLLLRLSTTLLLSLTARKDKKKYTDLILYLLDVVAALCYYNPSAFLSLLESAGLTQAVFNVWMSYEGSDSMATSFHHSRMSVIAMSVLSTLPLSSLPPLLAAAFPDVVTLQVKRLAGMIEMYKIAAEEEKAEEDEYEAEQDDDDEEYEGELWDQDADAKDEENMAEEDGQDENSDGEDETQAALRRWEDLALERDQGDVDEAHFPSPLDDIDEFVAFDDMMTRLRQREPQWARKYDAALSREHKVRVAYDAVLAKAVEQRHKQEEERRNEAADGDEHDDAAAAAQLQHAGDDEKKSK